MQSDRIEHTILCNLFHKEEFARKVLPFIKDEYFTNRLEQDIFTTIFNFITKYNNVPTKDAILIEINSRKDINDTEHTQLKDYVNTITDLETDDETIASIDWKETTPISAEDIKAKKLELSEE